MTEKHYGGESYFGYSAKSLKSKNNPASNLNLDNKSSKENKPISNMEDEEMEKTKKAGDIVKKVVSYAKTIIKKDFPLLEIADKIESKIIELGAKPAFPVNLSINEIAAHSTPLWNDTEKARGLLKVDIGVHIDGYTADTAFSIDLENSEENKKLINSAEEALEKALKIVEKGIEIRKIGIEIEKAIKSHGFQAIRNLSGHSIKRYELHAGLTIPNFDNLNSNQLEEGIYAIEPFSTSGFGSVKDGKSSTIYHLMKAGSVRDNFAREVLSYIVEEYSTLPFCSRWIYKKFGSRGLLALKRIEESNLLHHYPQLIEKGNGKVAQAEHTIIITNKEKIIIT